MRGWKSTFRIFGKYSGAMQYALAVRPCYVVVKSRSGVTELVSSMIMQSICMRTDDVDLEVRIIHSGGWFFSSCCGDLLNSF